LQDNTTFILIANYSEPPFGRVSADNLLLVSPAAATADGTALNLLRTPAPQRTDSYVLSVTNNTFLPELQELAATAATPRPLCLRITSHISAAARFNVDWPKGGLMIRRPVVWVGSAAAPTSMDLGMEAGQFVLQGEAANVSLVNLYLENLGYGDEQSSRMAEGNSIMLQNQLWSFQYRR
jgi:hypothetical protein